MSPPAAAAPTVLPRDLPLPRAEVLSVLRALADPQVDNASLVALVGRDPVLTADLLRLANSPFYGAAAAVRSLDQALVRIGHRTLRSRVLCLAAREVMRAERVHRLEIAPFWEASVRRALAGRLLARRAGLDEEAAFTVGLMQDLGLLALFVGHPGRAGWWSRLQACDPERRRELEAALFSTTHDQVARELAVAWRLPESMGRAIAGHHEGRPGRPPTDPAAIAAAADWLAAVLAVPDDPVLRHRAMAALGREAHLEPESVADLLNQIEDQVAEAGTALGGEPPREGALVREAGRLLLAESQDYQALARRLEQTLAERDRLAAELEAELDRARVVQGALLPAAGGDGCAGISLPARRLSGDFYDHFPLPDGRVVFCLGDVAGKGMDAALLMARTSGLVRCLGKTLDDPARLLAVVNREVCEAATGGRFVTLAVGIYDPGQDRVRLASAGHLPALHLVGGEAVRAIPAQGPPLGVLPEARFGSDSMSLAGGSLYLFSDGLLEARVGEAALGFAGIEGLLRETAHLPAAERLARVVARVQNAGGPTRDDVTLLVVGR